MLVAHNKTFRDAEKRLIKEGYEYNEGIWIQNNAVALIIKLSEPLNDCNYMIIYTFKESLNC